MTQRWHRADTLCAMHRFHIPVMGIGFTIDSALRVAKYGIGTVMSLVDDRLIERVRRHYDPQSPAIGAHEPDARAKRITAWLDYVDAETKRQMETLSDADKRRYRELVGHDCELVRGAIEVNIMTKVDSLPSADAEATESYAKAALRGWARSTLQGAIVFSAGVNPALYGYLAELGCKKPVILKVSDLRSAQIQTKFLAKKGIPVAEYRIESGLNCGGHVFPTDGELMGPILAAFQREMPGARVTAQGGVGNHGEMRRLLEHYGVASVGWGSPFLLVPEVTLLDDATRAQLAAAREKDLYVSESSPLGIQFNNLRGSSSEKWHAERSGSGCPNRYLATNTEFGKPLCTASAEYLKLKGQTHSPKQCICDHLGNPALLALGIEKRELPVAVCPGPNLAYFDKTYTLEQMVDHIYGRAPSIVPQDRPHMFAKELSLYVDHWLKKPSDSFREKLLEGIAHYRALCERPAYPGENLASLRAALDVETARLQARAQAA